VVLPALSKKSFALGFLQKFSEGGVPGGGIEPVQQSGVLSTKPRRLQYFSGFADPHPFLAFLL
jgi:hypothetical protein